MLWSSPPAIRSQISPDAPRRGAWLRRGYQAIVNLRIETTRVARASKNSRATAGVEVLAFGTGLELRRDPR